MWQLAGLTTFMLAFCQRAFGIDNCYHKVFVPNTPHDNMLFGTGLLLEVVVPYRAECVSLCQLKLGCNVILYNSLTTTCRLQNYQHDTQAGTGIPTAGWANYALQCSEPPSGVACDIPDVSSVGDCAPCLLPDNTWRSDDFCIIYRNKLANNGGVSNKIPLDFELEAGMIIVAHGSMYVTDALVGICLESTTQGAAHLGIYFQLSPIYCEVYDESNNIRCDIFLTSVVPSSLTFKYIFTNSVIKLHLDGQFYREFPNVLTRDRLDVYGFSDVEYVVIIKTPQSCILP